MNTSLRWFRRIGFLGIALNLTFIVPALAMPDMYATALGLSSSDFSNIWMQNAGALLVALSAFYVPGTLHPARWPVFAWLNVGSRLLSAGFWFWLIRTSPLGADLKPMLAMDGSLGVILGLCLQCGLPPEHKASFSWVGRGLHAVGAGIRAWWARPIAKVALVALLAAAGALGYGAWRNLLKQYPEVAYASDVDHFKYGAIGLGQDSRIPYYLWEVLPEVFPDKLPAGRPPGWAAFGLLQEPKRPVSADLYGPLGITATEGPLLPVGFALRRIGFPSVEPNCAMCHTGSYRTSAEADPAIVVGGPAHALGLQSFQQFLFGCASDPRFNSVTLLAAIDAKEKLGWFEKLLYRTVIIPAARSGLLQQKASYAWQQSRPPQGWGRTDTFNPTKINVFHLPDDGTIGTTNLPAIWNQRAREHLWLHWDGNNDEITQRNYAAAMAVGATPQSVLPASFKRVTDFVLDLPPPKYPFAIDRAKADRGRAVYEQNCAQCHAFGEKKVGQVTDIAEIGTDRHRLDSFTEALVERFHTFTTEPFVFTAYRKTNGYSDVPIDGCWNRAPYLHHGAVPTLWDLLQPPASRPTVFYTGYDVYDPVKAGFVHDGPARTGGFLYDVTVAGNANSGHTYGTTLPDGDKWDLIEYLKTL
jgi:mono/diheme cytochrome c family protein